MLELNGRLAVPPLEGPEATKSIYTFLYAKFISLNFTDAMIRSMTSRLSRLFNRVNKGVESWALRW